jgi:4-hydroxy-tetrahydrodipicolinate synthase
MNEHPEATHEHPGGGTRPSVRDSAPRAWLSGIVPPVCTPFGADGEVDTESLERHLTFLLDAGVNGLFMLGSSSEVAFLTDRQRDLVLEVAVKTAAGAVPVLAGAIDLTTSRVLDQALRAKQRGVDAIVATAPFYARATHPAELEIHFRALRQGTGLPLVAYDIPVAVHSKLDPALVLQLAAAGVIDAVKDSSNDIHGFRALVTGARQLDGLAVFTGSELVVDCALFLGADGAVPGLANVDPHGFVALYQSCRSGEWDKARDLQDRLVRLFALTSCANPAKKGPSSSGLGGFKTALMLRGVFAHNFMGLPQIPLDADETRAVRAVLEQEGLL